MLHIKHSNKKCPACNSIFRPRRTNQVYCDSMCRSFSNNRLAKKRIDETKVIDKKLHDNRNILKKIHSKKGQSPVSRDYLLGAGLDLDLFNSTVKAKEDSLKYNLCYEYGLASLGNNNFKISIFKL